MKIAFIGAGSYGFTHKLLADILTYDSLRDSDLAFMDVDSERLDALRVIAGEILEQQGLSREAMFTTDRRQALEGADFVLNLVKIGFNEMAFMDLRLPKKYGLKQTIGDTCGVGGVFRGLRTMPFCMRLCKDIAEVAAPGAMVLNYTNPQSMLVMAVDAVSNVPFVGLCHSVQGTTRAVARYLDVPYDELRFRAAGINHMNWLTQLRHGDQDLYPRLRTLVRERGIYGHKPADADAVQPFLGPARLDMLLRCGYVVTESSTHFAEYVPFYARTDELLATYQVPVDEHMKNMEQNEQNLKELLEKARQGQLPELTRSAEYGARIMNAVQTNEPIMIYANVMNRGLVNNLPADSCVEVASLVDGNGVQPCAFGSLPTAPAAMCRMDIHVHQLAVEAILQHDRTKVYQALMMDPLTHSRLTIDEIEAVADELIDAQQEYLGDFFPART